MKELETIRTERDLGDFWIRNGKPVIGIIRTTADAATGQVQHVHVELRGFEEEGAKA